MEEKEERNGRINRGRKEAQRRGDGKERGSTRERRELVVVGDRKSQERKRMKEEERK